MKKIILFILFLIILILTILFLKDFKNNNSDIPNNTSDNSSIIAKNMESEKYSNINSVKYNGWLKTKKYNLLNEKDEKIQLRGLSSHGICWYSDLLTYDNLKNLKETWNINVFRIAMYTEGSDKTYINNPMENKEKIYKVIDFAIDLDMYVIIDWHILSDHNPQIHKEDAKEFFDEVSKKYHNCPNVIYEICNEPNGTDVDWNNSIKPYAEEIIPIIRNNSNKSLIIVGTPFWCQNIDEAADNPLDFDNVVYSCHFYSGSHGEDLRNRIDYCISKNIPVFISECGTTNVSGDGNIYLENFQEWIDYLNEKNISWINWSFSNKNESSAILTPEYSVSAENKDFNNYLTESGKFIKKIFCEN